MPKKVEKLDIAKGEYGDFEVVSEKYSVHIKDKTVRSGSKLISDTNLTEKEAMNIASVFASSNREAKVFVVMEQQVKKIYRVLHSMD